MKTKRDGLRFISLVAGWLFVAVSAHGATFSILPASISNTYAGTINLQIGGLVTGETVVVDRYLDANTNGVVDATDWPVQSLQLTDGQASTIGGVTNLNVAYDANPTNGTVTAALSFPAASIAQRLVGAYLFRLSSPTGRFPAVTGSFAITHTAFPQWFAGQAKNSGTNVPYAGILVFDTDGSPIAGSVADGAGNYTNKMAPGTYQLAGVGAGFVCDMEAAPTLTLGAGVPIATNLNLIAATRLISGRFVNATNASLGIAGLLVGAQSTGHLLALSFPGATGNFTLPVTADGWEMFEDDQELPSYGYLRPSGQPSVDTTTGNVSGVTVALPMGTALFYGTVTDDLGQPLAGISLYAGDTGDQYESSGTTDANGRYSIAALAGDWHVGVSEDSPAYGNYIFSRVDTNIAAGQAVRLDFAGVAAATISGTVRGGGAALSGGNVEAGIVTFTGNGNWDWQGVAGTDVGSDGTYTLTVPPGTNYTVQARGPDGSAWLEQYYNLASNVQAATRVSALTNAPATNINFNLQLGGIVRGHVFGGGAPLGGLHVEVGTIAFSAGGGWNWVDSYYGDTDASGAYSVTVPAGSNYYAEVNLPDGSIWLRQFYGSVMEPNGATFFEARTNATTDHIDFNLELGAHIGGRVRGGGAPLADAQVQAGIVTLRLEGGWDWQHVASSSSDTNGDYTLTVPAGTNYTVQAQGPDGSAWQVQYYTNATDATTATPVAAFTNAPTAHIDFNLVQGAVVSGRVLGNGNPLGGINVQVAVIIPNGDSWYPWQSYFGTTDSNGDYRVYVPSGSNCCAWVDFQAGSVWMCQFYSNTVSGSEAAVLVPRTNAPATGIDFDLRPGSTVTLNVNTNAGGTASGAGLYLAGSTNWISATASNGWRFTGWADGPADNPREIVLWSNVTYTACFAPAAVQAGGSGFGVRTNRFGFTITGTSNMVVVVEACTNLLQSDWSPVYTNTLTGGSCYFSDPNWTNHPKRFYRLQGL